jgi:hypothetical protein
MHPGTTLCGTSVGAAEAGGCGRARRMGKRGKTSDHWVDEFFWWLEANGLTRRPGVRPPQAAALPTRGREGSGRFPVMVAAAIYFFVVTPMNVLAARRRSGQAPPDPTTKSCPECLSEVPIAARRCRFCAQPLSVAGSAVAERTARLRRQASWWPR